MTPHRECNAINCQFPPLRRLGQTDGKFTIFVTVLCVFLLAACIPVGLVAWSLSSKNPESRKAHTQTRDNLYTMALAMHNFYDVEGHWVSGGTTGADGQLAHSWQTHLLPYMDQVGVYQSIDLDVAWDDPSQSHIFGTVIPSYHHPSQVELFTPSGHATSHYAGNIHVFLVDNTLNFRDVTDGTSNTIAVGEVTAGFKAWGDPTNLRNPANGIGGGTDQFGSAHEGGAFMVLMDGSVVFIKDNIDPQVFQALATPDGGEVVGEF